MPHATPASAGARPVHILLAEDERTSRLALAGLLRRWGHEVREARDGAEAWDILQEDDAPGIGLIDWMMPRMDGVEVCRRVRAAAGATPYLILVTAKAQPGDLVEALDAGADDYVVKPFRPEELRARLGAGIRVLDLQRRLARRQAELAEGEALLRAVVNGAHDGVVLIDLDGVVRDWNPAAARMFARSRDEAMGRPFTEIALPERSRGAVRRRLRQAAGADEGDDGAVPLLTQVSGERRGGEFPIELSVARIVGPRGVHLSVFVRDLTERHRLEVELGHAQKLESVGRLAAGIAHEINTPIQFLGDNLHFLAGAAADLLRVAKDAGDGTAEAIDLPYLEEEIPKAVEQTLEGVARVANIVRAMKDFAHPGAGEHQAPADLNHAIRSTLTVARNELKYVAEVETDFGDLPSVTCYLDDLNQVVLNLLINAAHAIGDVVRGTDEKGVIRVRTAHEGPTVLITVSDTGCGIPPENRTKIFDPFFTTKEVGRGTGQGLAIARAVVVEKHRGQLWLESAVGRGTTFFVRLPVGGAGAAEEAAA